MASYNVGENVKCRLVVEYPEGTLYDPSSLPTITIYDPNGTVVVSAVAETYESLGTYYYSYPTTANSIKGRYAVKHIVTDGSTVTIQWDEFELGH
jgi:uncharacterized protein YfaS (alpha-2-macroglobulin family)